MHKVSRSIDCLPQAKQCRLPEVPKLLCDTRDPELDNRATVNLDMHDYKTVDQAGCVNPRVAAPYQAQHTMDVATNARPCNASQIYLRSQILNFLVIKPGEIYCGVG